MEKKCPKCGNLFESQAAPGIQDVCPRCMAEFLKAETREVNTQPEGIRPPAEKLPIEPGGTFHGMDVLEFIGRGGMGFVYKARQPNLDRIVALKILDPRLAVSLAFTERFNREARALASLNHPNIVQVYDFGKEGELHFLVMEFIDGSALRRILMTQRLSPQTALRYVPQICDALEYAHSQGVIHRDIKPENILIDTRGNLKIADFGLAKITVTQNQADNVTVTGQYMGTPHYMAPEQSRSAGKVDQRADIYSLGVVFYEMLTGELPIGRFPLPSQQVRVDVRVDDVVLKALENEPARRYQRASEIKDDVSKIDPAEPLKDKVVIGKDGISIHDGQDKLEIGKDGIKIVDGQDKVEIGKDGIKVSDSLKGCVNIRSKRSKNAGAGVCFLVILLASFLNWGTMKSSSLSINHQIPSINNVPEFKSVQSGQGNAWNSHLTLFGEDIPNWILVIVSAAIVVFGMHRSLNLILAGYGLLHSGLFGFVMLNAPAFNPANPFTTVNAGIGLGCILTFIGFAAHFILLIVHGDKTQPAEESAASPQLKPHNAGGALALGIIGLAFSVLCGIFACFSVTSVAVFALPGLIISIIALSVTRTKITEIQAGRMDPTGKVMAQAGKICGIIGILMIVILGIFFVINIRSSSRSVVTSPATSTEYPQPEVSTSINSAENEIRALSYFNKGEYQEALVLFKQMQKEKYSEQVQAKIAECQKRIEEKAKKNSEGGN